MIAVGLISGAMNGFFGAGGGLSLVPLCKYVGKLETKKAHATTLVCVLLMCICGGVVYFANQTFDLKLIFLCLIGSMCGSFIGTKLLRQLKSGVIDLIFSIVIISAGILMIIF